MALDEKGLQRLITRTLLGDSSPSFSDIMKTLSSVATKLLIAIICTCIALIPIQSYAWLPLAAQGLPLAMRIGAPLSTTAFRWLVQRVGQSQAYAVASTEVHLWLGAALLGVTFSKPSSPLSTDVPSNSLPIDGPIVWLDNELQSKYSNPDSTTFSDAQTSGDKQPTPKTSVDKTGGYPSAPSSFPAVVQQWGGGPTGWGIYKSSLGSQTKSVRTKFQYVNVDIALANLSSLQRCVSSNVASVRPEGAPASHSWCGSVNAGGTTSQYAVWQKTIEVPCDAGYTRQADGGCTLQNATQVSKPANHQCEYIRTSAGWTPDPKNPNCAAYTTAVSKPDANTLQIRDGQRTDNPAYPTIDSRIVSVSNGQTTITDNDPGGTVYSATVTPNSNGQQIITGLNTSGNSTTAPGNTPSQGSGSSGTGSTGSSTSTGSTGSGGGSCGGTNQPACAIDDSGFNGKTLDVSSVQAQLSSSVADFNSAITANTNNPHQIGKNEYFPSLRFGLPETQCQSPELSFFDVLTIPIDLCNNSLINLFRQISAWGMYVYTMFYVWRRFMSAEQVEVIQ